MNGSLAADTPNKNMLSGMDPLPVLNGDEFVEVIKKAADGSFKNYRVSTSKLKETLTAYDFAVRNGFVGTLAQWLDCTRALYSRDGSMYGKVLVADEHGVGRWSEVDISIVEGLQDELDRVLAQVQASASAAAASANTANQASTQAVAAVSVTTASKNAAQASANNSQIAAARSETARDEAAASVIAASDIATEVQGYVAEAITAKDAIVGVVPAATALRDAAQAFANSAEDAATLADTAKDEAEAVIPIVNAAKDAAVAASQTANAAKAAVAADALTATSAKNAAASSATTANTAKDAAAASKTATENLTAQAINARDEAHEHAEAAEASVASIQGSVALADAAKVAAAGSATAAQTAATQAIAAKDSITGSVTAAQTAAADATASKNAANTSAGSAGNSATLAANSRDAAEGFADAAQTAVSDAQNVMTQATAAKNAAAASATAAATSKSGADTSATAASGSASAALTSKNAAAASATSADTSKTAAAGSATAAAASAAQAVIDFNNVWTDLLDPTKGANKITYRATDIAVANAESRSIQLKLDGSRDLSDFKGFVGNGIADDSDAYERAVNWQISKTVYWKPSVGGVGEASTVLICPGLTIPKGARIKLTRTMPSAIYLAADGFASMEAGPNVNMILGNASYRTHYENIFFIGGLSQIHLNNQNVNFGLWMFRNCTFSSSNGLAVQLRNTSTTYGVTSTQAIFDNCRWSRCRSALFTECDHTFVTGGWTQPYGDNMDPNTPVFKHVGLFTMTDMMLIPSGVFGAKCRWIDSWGGLRLTKVRFGGENGGLPAVYWYAIPPKFVQGTDESIEVGVIFDGCTHYFGALARPDAGGIVLQGQCPRTIRFTNCTGPIGGRLIHNDPADGGIADIAGYFAYLKTQWGGVDMYQNFSFHYTGMGIKVGQDLWPSALDTYSYTDRGRVVETRAHLSDPGTVIPSGTETRMSFDTQTLDPYKYAYISSGATVIKAPVQSSFARLHCCIEGPTSTANGQRYIARVYFDNVATNIVAYYTHDKDGQPRFNFTGALPVVPTKDLDVRITQASGAPINFTGTITVDFDVRQF